MDLNAAFAALGIALALGLLVGIQRERADSALAGIRTFPLITILGVLCGMISEVAGAWVLAAGILALAAASAVGNSLRPRTPDSPGITTEVAILIMFAVGALLWLFPESREVPVAVGVACAVLLHLKAPLHGLAARISDADIRAVLQFALITFIVLPVLPDRSFGPFGAINPHNIWLMVVLVVGISLSGYIIAKFVPRRSGLIVSGVLGGLISSTATTGSYSRRARQNTEATVMSAVVIAIASCMVFGRIAIEIATIAPSFARTAIGPLAITAGGAALGALLLWLRAGGRAADLPESRNPTELRSALTFAVLYALVVLATAAANHHLGPRGLYAAALISGLTDMDAITLSTSRLVVDGSVPAGDGWRAIVLAALSNTAFKWGMAGVLGGRALFRLLAVPALTAMAAGIGTLLIWAS